MYDKEKERLKKSRLKPKGLADRCICPKCGQKTPHRGIPCGKRVCSKCEITLKREEYIVS